LRILKGTPAIKKVQNRSGERHRGNVPLRQEIFKNKLPAAPVGDHKRRTAIQHRAPLLLSRSRPKREARLSPAVHKRRAALTLRVLQGSEYVVHFPALFTQHLVASEELFDL
jgi:hypothetical protein